MPKQEKKLVIDTSKLVDVHGMIAALFPEGCGPSVRTVRTWQKKRLIPFIKIRGLVFFDLEQVREALRSKKLIRNL